MARSRKRAGIAFVLAFLGGAAIIMGTLLTWIDAGQGISVGTQTVTGTPKGTEFLLGQVALAGGIAAVVLALLLLVAPRAGRVWGAILLVAAATAIAPGVVAYSQPQKQYVDYAAAQATPKGSSTSNIEASLNNLFEVNNLEAKPGLGSYAAVGGGVATLLAGLLALFGRRRSSAVSTAGDEPQLAVTEDPTAGPPDVGETPEAPPTPEPPRERPEGASM